MTFLFADKHEGPEFPALLAEARAGGITREGWHKRADGAAFWATFTISPLTNGSFQSVTSTDSPE